MKKSILLLALYVLFGILLIAIIHSSLPYHVREGFLTLAQSRTAARVTEGSVAPLCPPGMSFFTDRDGKSMCCRGRIGHTDGRCQKLAEDRSTLPHMCSLGGEETDEFGEKIQFCGSMFQSLLSELGAKDCTTDKPFRATQDGRTGYCCSAPPTAAMPHKCPANARSCVVLDESKNENPFTKTNSCALERLRAGAKCPAGMRQTMLVGDEGQITNMSIPMCMTTNIPRSGTSPMCIPPEILTELRRFGIYRDKDMRRWIGSCDVYKRVNIDKTETKERVDLSPF